MYGSNIARGTVGLSMVQLDCQQQRTSRVRGTFLGLLVRSSFPQGGEFSTGFSTGQLKKSFQSGPWDVGGTQNGITGVGGEMVRILEMPWYVIMT